MFEISQLYQLISLFDDNFRCISSEIIYGSLADRSIEPWTT